MEENVQLTDVDANIQSQAPAETQDIVDTNSQNVSAPENTEQTQTEKMIPQSQVNKIAAREARVAAEKAAERTRQQMLSEFEVRQNQSTPPVTQGLGGMDGMSPEMFDQRVMEVAHRMSLRAMGDKIAQDFDGKINAAMDDDPEFAEAFEESGIKNSPHLIMWTNELENTADTVKEMVKNPEKFAQIMMLVGSGAHGMAKNALKRLSSSIKTNVEAQKQPVVKEPLSQIKPTNIGTADNASLTVSDFKNQPWLRG